MTQTGERYVVALDHLTGGQVMARFGDDLTYRCLDGGSVYRYLKKKLHLKEPVDWEELNALSRRPAEQKQYTALELATASTWGGTPGQAALDYATVEQGVKKLREEMARSFGIGPLKLGPKSEPVGILGRHAEWIALDDPVAERAHGDEKARRWAREWQVQPRPYVGLEMATEASWGVAPGETTRWAPAMAYDMAADPSLNTVDRWLGKMREDVARAAARAMDKLWMEGGDTMDEKVKQYVTEVLVVRGDTATPMLVVTDSADPALAVWKAAKADKGDTAPDRLLVSRRG